MSSIYKDERSATSRAGFELYQQKGSGFFDQVHRQCLESEPATRGVRFVPQQELSVCSQERPLKSKYLDDLLRCGKIIVELNAVQEVADEPRAQVQSYLKATGRRLALLINFGHSSRTGL
jgi:GxxExxY protein